MHLQFEEFWNCVSDIYNSICYYGSKVADIYFNNASLFCLVTEVRGSHESLLLVHFLMVVLFIFIYLFDFLTFLSASFFIS